MYQKENGIARGCEGIEKSTMMELMSFLGISYIHDRIVKNEDAPLKGQLGFDRVPFLRYLAFDGPSNL